MQDGLRIAIVWFGLEIHGKQFYGNLFRLSFQTSPTFDSKGFRSLSPTERNPSQQPPPPPARKSTKTKGLVPPSISTTAPASVSEKPSVLVPGAVGTGVLSTFNPRPMTGIAIPEKR